MSFNNPTNITGFVDFFNYINYVTEGMFGVFFLVAIAVVSFLVQKAYTTERALLSTMFLTTIIAVLMRFVDLISDGVLAFCVLVLGFAVIYAFMERSNEGL